MANLDTAAKRSSAVGIAQPYVFLMPTPDGSVSQADRQDIAFSYSGILALSPLIGAISKVLTLFTSLATLTLEPSLSQFTLFDSPKVLTAENE